MKVKLSLTFSFVCHIYRPNVCGNILQGMKSIEKVPSLCLRLMEKRIRWVMNSKLLLCLGYILFL